MAESLKLEHADILDEQVRDLKVCSESILEEIGELKRNLATLGIPVIDESMSGFEKTFISFCEEKVRDVEKTSEQASHKIRTAMKIGGMGK